jgi:hypothetical protein
MISGLLVGGRARQSQDECRYKLIERADAAKGLYPSDKGLLWCISYRRVARNE